MLMTERGRGFCSTRSWLSACRRRVVVLVVQFPPIAGAEAASGADVAPRVQTASTKTLKMGCCGRGGLLFGLNGAGHGARGWAGAPVG